MEKTHEWIIIILYILDGSPFISTIYNWDKIVKIFGKDVHLVSLV